MPFHGILTWCLQNQENGQKYQKNIADFIRLWFSTLSHWYEDLVKAALEFLKHAEMQTETRCAQGFSAKSGASVAKPWLSFFLNSIICLSDSNSLGDKAVYTLSTRFLDGSGTFLVHLGLKTTSIFFEMRRLKSEHSKHECFPKSFEKS